MRRSAVLCVLVAAACLALAPICGIAAGAVPGSEYAITFEGKGSVDLHRTIYGFGEPEHFEESEYLRGTWDIVEDIPAEVWLPATTSAAAAGAYSTGLTGTRLVPSPSGGLMEVAEPTTLEASGEYVNGEDEKEPYACTVDGIYDNGNSNLSATLSGGSVVIATGYQPRPGAEGPAFYSEVPGFDPQTFHCQPQGVQQAKNFGYENTDSEGQAVRYSADLPLAEVGQSPITLPATDGSTVPPCGVGYAAPSSTCSGPNFHLEGAYTLRKVCDGAITYSGTTVTGTCGAGAGGEAPTQGGKAHPETPPHARTPRVDKAPPDTKITKVKVKAAKRTATLSFSGSGGGGALSFQCKLDHQRFKKCKSPRTYRKLKPGKHTFQVRAVDPSGAVDPTPARRKFKLKRGHGKGHHHRKHRHGK